MTQAIQPHMLKDRLPWSLPSQPLVHSGLLFHPSALSTIAAKIQPHPEQAQVEIGYLNLTSEAIRIPIQNLVGDRLNLYNMTVKAKLIMDVLLLCRFFIISMDSWGASAMWGNSSSTIRNCAWPAVFPHSFPRAACAAPPYLWGALYCRLPSISRSSFSFVGANWSQSVLRLAECSMDASLMTCTSDYPGMSWMEHAK